MTTRTHSLVRYWKNYLTLLAVLFAFVSIHSLYNPLLDHADSHSDGNTMIAGQNFYEYGFSPTYGLPLYNFTKSAPTPETLDPDWIYTHYPPGSEQFNGTFRFLGVSSLGGFRFISILISFLALLLVPLLFLEMGLGASTSFWAAAAYAVNYEFLRYIDGLHNSPYVFFSFALFGVSWLKYAKSDWPKRHWFLVPAVLAELLSFWVSFEYFLFLPLFALLSTFVFKNFRRNFWGLVLVGLVPPLTMGFRLYHNSLLFGSIADAVNDFRGAANERLQLTWLEFLYNFQASIVDYLLPIALPLLLAPIFRRGGYHVAEDERTWTWVHVLGLCGLSWWLAMRQHAVHHHHTILLFLPWMALLTGIMLRFYWYKSSHAISRRRQFAALGIFILIVVGLSMKLLTSPHFNRYITLSPKMHSKIQRRINHLKAVQQLGENLPGDTFLYIDVRLSKPTAFYFQRPFRYIGPEKVCDLTLAPQEKIVLNKRLNTPDCLNQFGQTETVGDTLIIHAGKAVANES